MGEYVNMQYKMNKFVLKSDVAIETRRAQGVDPKFYESIRGVLKTNRKVIAGYLLDARKPNDEETFLIIALTLEDERKDYDLIARQLWDMLQQFPQYIFKTFITSSAPIKDTYFGCEFYIRRPYVEPKKKTSRRYHMLSGRRQREPSGLEARKKK